LVKVACRNQQGRAELIQDLAQDVYLRIFADDSKCLRSGGSRRWPAGAGAR
jgi:DNA-directed RNA polymerase specialized sigma24 family protein